MRWNQLANDVPRAEALADILCAAVAADGRVDDAELVVVDAMLMKVLGVAALPDALREHIRGASRKRSLDLENAYSRLALTTERERKALLQVVTEVAQADGKITKSEKKFLDRLGDLLDPPPAP
ncbi:MAG: TerB family tellurite resistance protein [Myxococcota bacterium]